MVKSTHLRSCQSITENRFSRQAIQTCWDRECVPFLPEAAHMGKNHHEAARRKAKTWKPKAISMGLKDNDDDAVLSNASIRILNDGAPTITMSAVNPASLDDNSQVMIQRQNEGSWAVVDCCSAYHNCLLIKEVTRDFLAPMEIKDAQPLRDPDDAHEEHGEESPQSRQIPWGSLSETRA
eukprot:2488167-Karenia_brevis.AAC.1